MKTTDTREPLTNPESTPDDLHPSVSPGARYRADSGLCYTVIGFEQTTDRDSPMPPDIVAQYDDGSVFTITPEQFDRDTLQQKPPSDNRTTITNACDIDAHEFHHDLLTPASICAKCGLSIQALTGCCDQPSVWDKCVRPQDLRDSVRKQRQQHAIE